MEVKKTKIRNDIKIIVLCMLAAILVISCGKKEEDYRQIQVYKIDGTATVARQGSSMDAYENMQLQSGDIVETVAESYLQLKLDEDKYILVEPDSKISLQATGNSVDSKTKIYLEKGAIVNQLDNPLSEDSSYEVTTPNSTMAVRGTTFRVEITYDEKGESYAKVAVYGGKVECNLVFPEGTIAEPVMVEKGTEVLIWGDDVETEYVGSGNITYEEMKTAVLDFLGEIIDRGEELSITQDELAEIKEAKEALENATSEGIVEEEDAEEVTEEELEEDDVDNTSEEETLAKKETVKEESVEKPKEEKPEQTTTQAPTVTPNPPSDGSSDSSGGSGGSGGDSTEGNNTPSGGGTTTEPTKQTCTVTVKFLDSEGRVFATKTESKNVGESISIAEPILKPTLSGFWMDSMEKEASFPMDIKIEKAGTLDVIFNWLPS